jgi:hypothetical protein
MAFFLLVEPSLELKHWQVYKTGWPYASGGVIKLAIAGLAKILGGKRFLGATFGKGLCGVFSYLKPSGLAVRIGTTARP